MKKSIIIILAVVAILVIWAVSVYNGLVTMDENVTGQWANVETQYQRRADLIPNLVNTVKGYATHEKETLEGVVAARSQATQIKVDAEDLTPEKLAEYQKAQGAVTSALGKLLAITENYTDLKANQNFLELHAQLETAKAEVLKPFPREEELKAKLLRLEELNALLNIDKREPEIVADAEAPEACEQPPARKTTDLER